MNDQVWDEIDDLPEEQPGELVRWMEPRPLSFGPTELSLAVGAAFALGLATAAAVAVFTRWGRPERRMSAPLQRRLRSWS